MTRGDLEAGWLLVLRHYETVVRALDTRPTAQRRKVSRRAVLEDCRQTRDIRIVAATHDVSPSVIHAILRRAITVANACERGQPPRPPRPRKTLTVTLTNVPIALIQDLDAWAMLRGTSRRDAACALLKIGIDVTSPRVEKSIAAALTVVRRARRQHAPKSPPPA